MAHNVNFRILLFLLAIVVLLNFSQFLLSTKKPDRETSRYPIAIVDMKADENNEGGLMADISATTKLKSSAVADPDSNQTCPNTDVLETATNFVEICPEIPTELGPENNTNAAIKKFIYEHGLELGGYYKPHNCITRQKIAVIIPFRGVHDELVHFLQHLHYFLIKQEAEYQIYVVEYGNKSIPFNRGYLFNVGFMEAQRQHSDWQCIVLHAAKLVPLNSRNLYRCSWYPKEMVAEVVLPTKNSSWTKYEPGVGGVISITPKQYSKVNGFSNLLFDQDENYYYDFQKRLQWANFTLEKSHSEVAKYQSLAIIPDVVRTVSNYSTSKAPLFYLDGLTSLVYDLDSTDIHSLYTLIRVGPPTSRSITFPLVQTTNGKLMEVLLNRVKQNSTTLK